MKRLSILAARGYCVLGEVKGEKEIKGEKGGKGKGEKGRFPFLTPTIWI
jgi:hypothetical protein